MVNYSSKRTALFKRASQLSALFDANVSIIISSNNGKVHDFVSQSTTHKMMYELYQERKRVDIWKPYVEKVQDELQELYDENASLRKELKLWNGNRESLHALSYVEADNLIAEMESAINGIQVRQNQVLEHKTVKTQRKNARQENVVGVVDARQDITPEVVDDVASNQNMPGYAMW